MFGANRKKFMEGGVESDYADDSSLYYSQQSMFPPHRADKDMLVSSSASSTGQLSQLGASLYGPQSALGFPMRGMNSSAAPQLSRSGLNQSASQLSSHASTPNSGTMHTPPSPSRGILPMSSRSVLNHSQQVGGPTGQAGGMGGGGERGGGGSGGGRSGSMGSPSRSSPSIIGMPKQQQARQPFTINSMSGLWGLTGTGGTIKRSWFDHPAPGMEPTLKTNASAREGPTTSSDCLNWRKVAKEFHLEYDKPEERLVPSTFNYNPAQQASDWPLLLPACHWPSWLISHHPRFFPTPTHSEDPGHYDLGNNIRCRDNHEDRGDGGSDIGCHDYRGQLVHTAAAKPRTRPQTPLCPHEGAVHQKKLNGHEDSCLNPPADEV
ncbi:CCR4-NOT transcription complex subunit 2-like protein [Lates japonicus]|uniref:CCR4-NOT transcription complex subunit 2-like protein n=1 Tax=Lates japonicus TaxID=270547 RepID=A0AAD3M601_LATJO|nr:CCR4-NOT transcription complex subunit 2-like protein [Lates japonicus]